MKSFHIQKITISIKQQKPSEPSLHFQFPQSQIENIVGEKFDENFTIEGLIKACIPKYISYSKMLHLTYQLKTLK